MSKRKTIPFEEAISRLDEIVAKLESDDTTLDESIQLYDEGVSLLDVCAGTLQDAEMKVEELRRKSDGVFERIETKRDFQ